MDSKEKIADLGRIGWKPKAYKLCSVFEGIKYQFISLNK